MTLLALSLLVLLSGPLLYRLVLREPRAFWGLDGFVLASVGGMILFHVLPTTLEVAGGGALLAMLAGLILPILAEQVQGVERDRDGLIEKLAVGVAFIGLFVHTVLDGITLAAQSHDEVSTALAAAVVLHRLPVALLVWWLVRPAKGHVWAGVALGGIAIATLLGFFVEESLHGLMEHVGFAYVQAFIAGSLLHVIAHHPKHEEDHHHPHHHHHDEHGHEHHDHGHHDHARDPHQEEPISLDVIAHDHAHPPHDAHDHSHDHGGHHDHPHHDHDHGHDGHAHHAHDHHHHHAHPHATMSGLGAICGVALVLALPLIERLVTSHSHALGEHHHHHGHVHDMGAGALVDAGGQLFTFTGYGERFWHLFAESAPALLLGYVLAGVFAAFLPRASTRWMRRGSTPVQALRGMIFGLPIPICSCGVVPLYQSLITRGVPASAGLAFLIATPELGIEALLLSIPLLGVELTIARLVAAALVALIAGWVIGRLIPTTSQVALAKEDEEKVSLAQRIKNAAQFGLGEVLDETGPWILVGLAIAALLVQGGMTESLLEVPDVAQVMLFALVSLPLYVCASGATPLAAGLIFAGASPGAALAFLLAGPATNVTTFGVLSSMHTRRIAVLFGLVVIGLSVLMGIGVNIAFDQLQVTLDLSHEEHAHHGAVQVGSAFLLIALFLFSLLRTGPRHWMQTVLSFGSHDHHHHDH